MSTQKIRNRLLSTTIMGGAVLFALTAASAVTLMAPTSVAAQDISAGTLTGTVTNADGAPIPGANVVVRSNEQGFSRSTTTDADGEFRSALVPIGSYTVTITAGGYNTVSQTTSVRLGGQSAYDFTLVRGAASGDAVSLDDVIVTGARPALDFKENATGISIDLEELVSRVPVGRDITSVALLAPTAVEGDAGFGNQPSLGGSSVAENAFYINGLNITNFDNYIGGSTVPFDFYRSVEVLTGGYPAEFGRATGGIVNAVTKSGSNEFKFALRGNFAPDGLRSQSPDTFAARNGLAEADASSVILEVGGPIIRDRLFFFALGQFQDSETQSSGILSGNTTVTEQDDPFYGVKLDGYITDDHRLEFTYFDTSRESVSTFYPYDVSSDSTNFSTPTGGQNSASGGESYVARYTGRFSDWLTLSAAYGVNEDIFTSLPVNSTENRVVDSRVPPSRTISRQQSGAVDSPYTTRREFYRADADIYFSLLGDHHVRAGYEVEKTELVHFLQRVGPNGQAFIYRTCTATTAQCDNSGPGGTDFAAGTQFVEINTFQSGGAFDGENTAFYIQDNWDVNEQLTLQLGVRLDQFANSNAAGVQFIDFDEEIGPRLGFNYDPFNDNQSRFFGSYGRYFLPVASNTSFRQGASELFFRSYFRDGNNDGTFSASEIAPGTGLPTLGAQLTNFRGASACPAGQPQVVAGTIGCVVTGDGTANIPVSTISRNVESTYEDEWILGYERRVFGDWTVGAALTYRDLGRSAEDVAIDAAVLNYCTAQGIAGCGAIWTGFHQYVIVNPGVPSTITLSDAINGETTPRTVNFTAAQLGYPEARRTYTALEFTAERPWDGVWSLQASWTVSESKGNYEGFVKSDVDQDDAGITQDFDQPGLTDGTEGLLPNHRAHSIKAFGSFQLTPDIVIGANARITSPRKYGCLGVHPTDTFAAQYGAASFFCGGVLTPRGTQFDSDWNKVFDVSLRYTVPLAIPGDLVLRADIFNLFNFESAVELNEFGEDDAGSANTEYQSVTRYQAPRFVRLGFDWEF